MFSKEEIVNGAKAREVMAIFAFTLLSCVFMLINPSLGVPTFIFSTLVVALCVSFLKRDNVRIAGLVAIVVLSLFSVMANGVKFGIDFSGGVRIPVLLERPVDSITMEEMVNTIKTRAASFGLAEVKVRPIGDAEIYVELPQSSPQLVRDVENLLSQQGVYQGVVDGKVAISGEDIYSGTIYSVPSSYLQGADWGVSFTVTQRGAETFARVAKGKAEYPLFMFLDRPANAIVIISEEQLMKDAREPVSISKSRAFEIAEGSLKLEGDDIELYLEEELLRNFTISPKVNGTKAIVSNGSALAPKLEAAGFVVVEKPEEEIIPQYSVSMNAPQSDSVVLWKGVGLLSAPRLVKSVTEGIANFGYTISGPAEGGTQQERAINAIKKEKELESILKGGALPVQITTGSKTVVPAPLGEEFLRLSIIGVIFALIAVSIMVALRYRNLKIIIPMITISFAEIIIMVALIGSFTIDLSAMAGLLAAIGVGIDAQIVVTDELLKKEGDTKKRMDKAFDIITTSVMVAVIAMLPLLLFSGLVEIIGFATSTVLGALLGLFISRPAYGAIAERLFD